MKASARITVGLLLAATASLPAYAAKPIRLNSLGFLPNQPKCASVMAAATNCSLVRPNGDVVFSGALTGPRTNVDTGELLFTADFSAFTNAGSFQLEVPGADRSASFRIGGDIYREPFVTVTRAMYLWRCGTAVSGMHHGNPFSHAACHTNDARLDYVGGAGSAATRPAAGTTRVITANTSSTPALRWVACSARGRISGRRFKR